MFVAVATCTLALVSNDAAAQSSYSLKNVEANPIPKAEHFKLWKEVALKACADSQKRFNLSQSECAEVISKRADACTSQLSSRSPAIIATTAAAKDVGRQFMQCATPYYFCKGVEVKTEDEVRAKCS